ncbi:MAG: hypothetical protein ABJC04_13210, partial [Verrucomicrobiota bacterium]
MRILSLFGLIGLSGATLAGAATVELKDKAAVTGKILTEKRDQIVVDIGYTTLVIPRSQVVKILETTPGVVPAVITKNPVAPAVIEAPVLETNPGLFSTNAKRPPEKSVRELVQ